MLWAWSKQFLSQEIPNQLTDIYFRYFLSHFQLNTLKGTITPLTEVILDFSTQRGTKPGILTPKRYEDYPRHFYMEVLPSPREADSHGRTFHVDYIEKRKWQSRYNSSTR